MTTVFKFQLRIEDEQVIKMPAGAKILCVQTQNDKVSIWAQIITGDTFEQRVFEIYGTGHAFRDTKYKRSYIGTFQLFNGSLVYHLFELKQQ